MAKIFTDKFLSNLKPSDKKYYIREATGFTLQVLPSGTKTFMFIYEVGGKRKYIKLGRYPHTTLAEAKKLYGEAVTALQRGEQVEEVVNPAQPAPIAEVLTVKRLIDSYLTSVKKPQKGSEEDKWYKEKKSIFENKLEDWHGLAVTAVTKKMAINKIESVRKAGNGAARNFYKATHALFQYAVDREDLVASPFENLKKVLTYLRNKKGTRFLTAEEIGIVWHNIDAGGGTNKTKRALKLILVTAQRSGEILKMHRNQIDGDWWTIPPENAKKTEGYHRVFLTGLAKELIGTADGFIFESPMADSKTGHMTPTTLSQQVVENNFYGVPKWTPHDLRRSARTHFSRLKVPREHGEAVLHHTKKGMVEVYDMYEFDEEKKIALQKWETELLKLITQSDTSE